MKNILFILVMVLPAICLRGNVTESIHEQVGVNVAQSFNDQDGVIVSENSSKQDGKGKAALNTCSDEVFLRKTVS